MKHLVFLLALLVAFPQPAQAQKKKVDLTAQTKEPPTLTCGGKDSHTPFKITGFYDYPPFSWVTYDEEHFQKTGQKRFTYHGFIAEPIQKALGEIGVRRINQVGYPVFDDAMKAGRRGQVDIVFTAYYQDDTRSGLDYIYPAYFGNPFVVVSRAEKKLVIKDPTELSGMKGVIRDEEGIEPIIKGILPTDVKISVVKGPEAAFKALLSGEADFMISSPYAAAAEARRFKVWKDIYIGSDPIRSVKIFAAFSKMSPCRIYKDFFTEKFSPLFADKAEAEKRMQKVIDNWAEMHKDTPPLEYEKPQS